MLLLAQVARYPRQRYGECFCKTKRSEMRIANLRGPCVVPVTEDPQLRVNEGKNLGQEGARSAYGKRAAAKPAISKKQLSNLLRPIVTDHHGWKLPKMGQAGADFCHPVRAHLRLPISQRTIGSAEKQDRSANQPIVQIAGSTLNQTGAIMISTKKAVAWIAAVKTLDLPFFAGRKGAKAVVADMDGWQCPAPCSLCLRDQAKVAVNIGVGVTDQQRFHHL